MKIFPKTPRDLNSLALPVVEIFKSIQGEATFAGTICIFLRLSGCNLRCTWCDTKYSYEVGEARTLTLKAILDQVAELGCEVVEVTGGEPLIHPETIALLEELTKDRRYDVLLETNGACALTKVSTDVHIIMDVKCPSSAMHNKLLPENFGELKYNDDVKFVVSNREDFEYACSIIAQYGIPSSGQNCIFSPILGTLPPAELAKWLVEEYDGSTQLASSRIKLGLQLHKILWPTDPRGR